MNSKKILMIGNSFSICVGQCLPEIVRSAGDSVKLVSAYIGGCVLERHWEEMVKADADPEYQPYCGDVWYIANGKVIHDYDSIGMCNVNTLLKDDAYDIVTIQQGSHASWKPETYEPFAGNLIARIRKEQPQAEIVIQQTWAYRTQDKRLDGEWGIGQMGMFERLDAAYRKLAADYGFRRIPTGTAVQVTRERTPDELKFRKISDEELASFRSPDLPPQAGDVVGAMSWGRNENGKQIIRQDNIHLNRQGEYLQGCVWFGALFGKDPRTITWASPYVSDETAVFLRECAYEALKRENYKF